MKNTLKIKPFIKTEVKEGMQQQRNMNEEDLSKLAPTLFGIEKKNNFAVPNNYFDELPERVQASILSNSKRKFNWFSLKLIAPSVVASIVIIIVLLNHQTSNSLDALTTPEIAQFLSWEGYNNINNELLAASYNNSDRLESTSIYTENEIVDYLIYEEIDLNSIYY